MMSAASEISSPVGVIAAAAPCRSRSRISLAARGIAPVLFALKGACDPVRVERFRHHWISVGQLGRATKLFRSEGCRDLIFIGTLVRPALSESQASTGERIRVLGRIIGGVSRRRRSSACRGSAASSSRTVFGWLASGCRP